MRTYCTGLPSTRQVAQALAGVVLLEREDESFAQHLGRDPVTIAADVARARHGVELSQRGPIVLGALVAAGRRQVGHLVVVAGDAFTGRAERVECGEALDVAVGEGEHR